MTSLISKLFLAFAVLVMTASVTFAAITLDAAKSQGLVGERPDGMLGIVTTAPNGDVQALVDTINGERMAKYNAIASKNGTAVDQVKALAGKTLIDRTPSGQYIMNAAGVWQKK